MTEQLKISTQNNTGLITLNNPKALNSLTMEMARGMLDILKKWESDDNIQVVLIDAEGDKAFCAGGDIRKIYDCKQSGDKQHPKDFFETEYRMDYCIHTYSKPIVIWADGIVMGGGMGIVNGATARIVTEKTVFAMPEITIGLYPDVGGSYFLNQMPGRVGLYLGLTGTRINAADALQLKLADYFIYSSLKSDLWTQLSEMDWHSNRDKDGNAIPADEMLKRVVAPLAKASQDKMPEAEIMPHQQNINYAVFGKSMHECILQFKHTAAKDPWIAKGLATLESGSPTSAHLIFEQYIRSKGLSLKECFKRELIMSYQCFLGNDFCEGIRALIVDKDKTPKWEFENIGEVSREAITRHFTLPEGETNPLDDL